MLCENYLLSVCHKKGLSDTYLYSTIFQHNEQYQLSRPARSIEIQRDRKIMEAHQIVPDIIDSVPPSVLAVSYPSGVKVDLGNELTPTNVKDQPSLKWTANPGKYYTLLMVDPDAPSRADPKLGHIIHWFVGNISGNDVPMGEVVAEYIGSGPGKDSGLHRYVFLVYEQGKKLSFDEPRTEKYQIGPRVQQNVGKIAEKYGLGAPIAGNFYVAQWDEWCDEMRKNFKH